MGASVIAYWPGIPVEQIDAQPGFWNDDKPWGDFMAEREDESDVLDTFRRLGASALLTYKTDGMEDTDVEWVTPAQLQSAAQVMQDAVRHDLPGVKRVLEVYARNARGLEPFDEAFLRDLADIEEIAKWAADQGTDVVTLEVNW
jgi:hypothetical protein